MENIKGKNLSNDEMNELFRETDYIDLNKLKKFFAFTKNNKPKYSPQDYFVLPANKLFNDKAESTTVGRYIFNRFILTDITGPLIKYMNYPMDSGKIEKLEDKMSQLFLEDKISSQEIFDFFDKLNWLGFSIGYFMNASLSTDFVITNPKIQTRKKDLLKQNAKEIENANSKVVADIEGELIGMAKDIYKDHPSMQIYDSGCRGSFGNNYKNTSIMRGIVKDFVDPSKSYVSTTSLDEGITPDDFKYYCDMSIAGTYGKAIETQTGGYDNKVMAMSFQSVTVDKKDTDCGTKKFFKVLLTDSNYKLFRYRFIKNPENGRLIELNDENKGKFIGKYVEMRSPLYCKNDKLCNACAGNYFYKLGIENIGLTTNSIGGTLLNKSMKAFHDSTVHLKTIDFEEYIFD